MKTKLIAEIGENHYGRWDIAKAKVREAAAHGATYAKLQTYTSNFSPGGSGLVPRTALRPPRSGPPPWGVVW